MIWRISFLIICSLIIGSLGQFNPDTPEERLRNNRLPNNLRPYRYELEITPDFYNFTGRGEVVDTSTDIYFECTASTNRIYLNLANAALAFESVNLFIAPDSGLNPPVPAITGIAADNIRQFLIIEVAFNLTRFARYRLITRSTARLFEDPTRYGLFTFEYEYSNSIRKNLASNFFPDFAREVFPCFDEPEYKAEFDITIVRRQGYRSVSVSRVERTETRANGWFADVFQRTERISTHGVGLYVLDFASASFRYRDKEHRVWFRPNANGSPIVILRLAPRMMDYFGNITDYDLPWDQIDYIALPGGTPLQTSSGILTYPESSVLFNSYTFNSFAFVTIATRMAFGVANQWFGHLVTPLWWHDQWMLDGMAGFYQYTASEYVFPQLWNAEELRQFYDVIQSLELDALNESYPLQRYSNWGLDARRTVLIRELLTKAPTMIRMMAQATTVPTFDRFIQRFVNQYQRRVASTDDFVNTLQAQVDDDGIRGPNNEYLNMTEKFETWVAQPLYPVVSVNRSAALGGDMILTQNEFITPADAGRPPSPYNYMWNIPVSYYSEDYQEIDTSTKLYMDRDRTVRAPSSSLPPIQKLFMINTNRTGYYRVEYDDEMHARIQNDFESGSSPIPLQMKAAVIDDAFEISQSRGEAKLQEKALNTTKLLKSENTYLPWMATAREFAFYELQLSRAIIYGDMQAYWLLQITPVYHAMGLNDPSPPSRELPITDRLLRTLLTAWACTYHHQNCTNDAINAFNTWRQNPFRRLPADSDWAIMCTAIRAGGSDEWDFVYNQLADRRLLPIGITRWLAALSCSREPWINQRFLERCVSGEITPFAALFLAFNDIGRELLWSHLKDNWRTTGLGRFKNPGMVFAFLGFHEESDRQELEDFIADYPHNTTAEECAYYFSRQIVAYNIEWYQRTMTWLPEWLEKNVPRPIPGEARPETFSGPQVGGAYMVQLIHFMEAVVNRDPLPKVPGAPPGLFQDLRERCTIAVLFGIERPTDAVPA